MDPWSIVKLANSNLRYLGVNTGVVGEFIAGPIGIAIGATIGIKKWVDSQNSLVFEGVKKREGCSHIAMLEGSPPTPSALLFVASHGGVAWRTGQASLYFWHPEATFKPTIFDTAMVQGQRGVVSAHDGAAFAKLVTRPQAGYGCSECRRINSQRQ